MRQLMWFSLESQASGHLSPLISANMEMGWNRKMSWVIMTFCGWHICLKRFLYEMVCVSTGAPCVSGKTSSCSLRRTTRCPAFSCQGRSTKRRDWMRSVWLNGDVELRVSFSFYILYFLFYGWITNRGKIPQSSSDISEMLYLINCSTSVSR